MGCLQISAHRVGESLKMTANRYGEALQISAHRVGEKLKISASLVCLAGGEDFIRFEIPTLSWIGADNMAGVIKYNTLIASGEWLLEEVKIEELL